VVLTPYLKKKPLTSGFFVSLQRKLAWMMKNA
jgi:hypothetical protein